MALYSPLILLKALKVQLFHAARGWKVLYCWGLSRGYCREPFLYSLAKFRNLMVASMFALFLHFLLNQSVLSYWCSNAATLFSPAASGRMTIPCFSENCPWLCRERFGLGELRSPKQRGGCFAEPPHSARMGVWSLLSSRHPVSGVASHLHAAAHAHKQKTHAPERSHQG